MGLSEMDAQVHNALARRYGNEGNITPRSHKPRPPPATCAVGGERVSTLLVALRKRLYGLILGGAGARAAKRTPARAAD